MHDMSDLEDRVAVQRAQREWHLTDTEMQALELRAQLTDHHRETCPSCGAEGWFLRAWLGRRHHPACGARWVESPGTWAGSYARQWGQMTVGVWLDPTTHTLHGCGTNLGCGCLVSVVGLPLLLLLWPLQVVAWMGARGTTSR